MRHQLNRYRDGQFFSDLYEQSYGQGGRRRHPTTGSTRYKDIYKLMGVSEPGEEGQVGYMDEAVSRQAIYAFAAEGEESGTYVTEHQSVENDPPARLWDALARGDYLRVFNARPDVVPESEYAGRTRRLVVDLKSQSAGLRVARALTPLFTDDTVGPYFSQFKILLSTTQQADRPLKNDKMVIYYVVGENSQSGADVVGDTLVSAITGVLSSEDIGMSVSPFYSRLTTAVSWAEETEDYIPGTQNLSFTQSRAAIIEGVIAANPVVPNEDALARLVQDAFAAKGIRPGAPHRHVEPPPSS